MQLVLYCNESCQRFLSFNSFLFIEYDIEHIEEFTVSDSKGTESRRLKVEKLGNILKTRVSKLRSRDGVDLVFLVDSSASVGSQNFYNEIKFIKKVKILVFKVLYTYYTIKPTDTAIKFLSNKTVIFSVT